MSFKVDVLGKREPGLTVSFLVPSQNTDTHTRTEGERDGEREKEIIQFESIELTLGGRLEDRKGKWRWLS